MEYEDIVDELFNLGGSLEHHKVHRKAIDEIEQLRENAKQDARYLSAYHRICQKHGIAPSSSDLIAAMEECDELLPT